jgi:hypothetical protein
METSVESCSIGDPPNQPESSGSSRNAPIFPNKFRSTAQSYVSSSSSSFSDTSSSSSEDEAYEPSYSNSSNPLLESTSLPSDEVS